MKTPPIDPKLIEAFGEPISVYGDAQAVDDGVLVDLGRGHRVTRTALDLFERTAPATPPTGWPVDLMGYATASSQPEPALARAVAMSKGICDVHRRQAIESERQGHTMRLWAVERQGRMVNLEQNSLDAIHEVVADGGDYHELRLRPNEAGGVTVMLPEDD